MEVGVNPEGTFVAVRGGPASEVRGERAVGGIQRENFVHEKAGELGDETFAELDLREAAAVTAAS